MVFSPFRHNDANFGVAGMMVIPPDMEGQVPSNWNGYVAVDDVDATAKAFVDAGGAVRRPPLDIRRLDALPWWPIRMALSSAS